MHQKKFQAWRQKSFVDYNTLPMMADVARKLAMIEQAVAEIKRAESLLSGFLVMPNTKIQAMRDTMKAADDLKQWATEAIGIVNDVRRNAQNFVNEQLRKE